MCQKAKDMPNFLFYHIPISFFYVIKSVTFLFHGNKGITCTVFREREEGDKGGLNVH